MQLRESTSLPDSFWNPRMNQGFQFFPILSSSSSAFHSRLSIFYAPFLAGRYGCKVWVFFWQQALPHNNPIQLFCFYPWKMSILTRAVWCCSYKEVFSDGEFGWVITSSTPKKKPPKQDGFFLCSKRRKKTKNQIKY